MKKSELGLIQYHSKGVPQFRIGQKVWTIYRRTVRRSEVLRYKIDAIPDKDIKGVVAFCTGYILEAINSRTSDFSFRACEMYETRKEAKAMAKWWPVKGISDEDWLKAVGTRGKADDFSDQDIDGC